VRILVVAVSARMLAQLAVADGYEVTAVDRFGDVDLRAIAPGATAQSNDAMVTLAADLQADAAVYGAGLENRPELVRQLSEGRELLGTPPELLVPVRNPWEVGAAAKAAGARAPETRSIHGLPALAGARQGMWLRKPLRGGGGRGVRRWMGGRVGPTEILQRHVYGLSCSAVAVGNGRGATTLGITEQLHRGSGFHWAGNMTPPRVPDDERAELEGQLAAVCTEVATRFGVRGAFGVDAIWDGHDAWVLEVNPRPPASLELFGSGVFEAHVRAARGLGALSVGSPRATGCAKVKLVLFADRVVRAPDPEWWPAGLVFDIPHAGETIKRDAPVCTLICATDDASEVAALGARLLATLPDAVPAGA
jgi:predicted ATP-grasp superfamily ATP-dependent carboligase